MLRVGIIGCGVIANLNCQGYLYSPDAEIVAVSDVDIKNTGKKLERWGIRTTNIYTDYKKMIDHEDLDIVDILTPHHLHAPMTEYAAKAGIPGISVQKPMAHTITDCDRIIEVCEENNVILCSFENFRFYPPYLKAKELLDQRIIGEPLNFRINTIGTGGPSMPLNLLKSYLWRTKVDCCGGLPMIYDDGIHKFSMALWLMNQERVESLYAWIDFPSGFVDNPANIIWRYPQESPDEPPKFGSMEFSNAPNLYYPSNYYACDEFIEISGTKGIMWLNQCTSGGNLVSKSPQYPPIITYVNGEVKSYGEELPRDWRYSFIGATQHFIKVMKEGGTPIYTGEQGKNLCIFAKMPYISYQRKQKVNWTEINSENEANKSCVVDQYFSTYKGLKKAIGYLRKVRKDKKKGKKQGLEHIKLKYQYNL